eukprot:ANDGO_01815.mRNA.1 hypothetical protein
MKKQVFEEQMVPPDAARRAFRPTARPLSAPYRSNVSSDYSPFRITTNASANKAETSTTTQLTAATAFLSVTAALSGLSMPSSLLPSKSNGKFGSANENDRKPDVMDAAISKLLEDRSSSNNDNNSNKGKTQYQQPPSSLSSRIVVPRSATASSASPIDLNRSFHHSNPQQQQQQQHKPLDPTPLKNCSLSHSKAGGLQSTAPGGSVIPSRAESRVSICASEVSNFNSTTNSATNSACSSPRHGYIIGGTYTTQRFRSSMADSVGASKPLLGKTKRPSSAFPRAHAVVVSDPFTLAQEDTQKKIFEQNQFLRSVNSHSIHLRDNDHDDANHLPYEYDAEQHGSHQSGYEPDSALSSSRNYPKRRPRSAFPVREAPKQEPALNSIIPVEEALVTTQPFSKDIRTPRPRFDPANGTLVSKRYGSQDARWNQELYNGLTVYDPDVVNSHRNCFVPNKTALPVYIVPVRSTTSKK